MIGFYHGIKKKECYHKNVQKITRTAGTWLIVSHGSLTPFRMKNSV